MTRILKQFLFLGILISFALITTYSNSQFLKKNKETINLSNYKYPSSSQGSDVTIAILATNDIHGQAYERDFKIEQESYKLGGYKLLSGIIDKIRKEFKNQFLWFDAGDQFTGTVENIKTKGSLMVDFYNTEKVDAVAVGNHEWDNKEPQLRKWLTTEMGRNFRKNNTSWTKEKNGNKSENLYLDANLKLKKGLKDDLPNQMPSKMFSFKNGKIKIGVIGLTTIETVFKTSYFPKDKFKILDYATVVEKLSAELRKKGATAVVILSHVGLKCRDDNFSSLQKEKFFTLKLRNITYNPNHKCKGEMYDLLHKLKKGTVDAVFSGHIHESIHHFINEIPVIQNPMSNIFTNVMYLTFKKDNNGNYSLGKNDKFIEGPIPLCSRVYTNNLRCNEFQDLSPSVQLRKFTFHGSKLKSNSDVEKIFSKNKILDDQINIMKKNIIFTTDVKLERSFEKENVLGNLMADIIRNVTKADVGMNSPGGLRYIWERGQVTEYDLNNMFPFGGDFAKYNVTGATLKKIIKVLQEGKFGYYSFSGVNMTIEVKNGNSHLDVFSLVLADGREIEDEEIYSFASSDFMLLGGDDMNVFNVNQKMTVNVSPMENKQNILKSVITYLKDLKHLKNEDLTNYMGRIVFISDDYAPSTEDSKH